MAFGQNVAHPKDLVFYLLEFYFKIQYDSLHKYLYTSPVYNYYPMFSLTVVAKINTRIHTHPNVQVINSNPLHSSLKTRPRGEDKQWLIRK